ncbi:MAG: hypothetical protein FWE61_03245 [Micrococcales bacterium]|nr:hypothetical protein [Micrococcales bacterium]
MLARDAGMQLLRGACRVGHSVGDVVQRRLVCLDSRPFCEEQVWVGCTHACGGQVFDDEVVDILGDQERRAEHVRVGKDLPISGGRAQESA